MTKKMILFAAVVLLIVIFIFIPRTPPNQVTVEGEKGSWVLVVNDAPFYIKGVGCGLAEGKKGEDYLKLAEELGANCVRTWGTDQGNKKYLNRAWKYGLMVDAGIWLNWADTKGKFSYKGENEYKKKKKKEILRYIKRFKKHPAILMWNVGNEALFFTKDESERIAFCEFLEEVIREIHRIDPNHPVVYAAAGFQNLHYFKKYTPSLDIIGMNMYGTIRLAQAGWDRLDYDVPYVITEYGPYLPMDRPKDVNRKPREQTDYQKAMMYKDYARQIKSFKGDNLGGFVFHLGETTQESLTWWNLNHGNLKKQSYNVISEMYTGKKVPQAPKIDRLILSKQKGLNPGELIEAKVIMKDGDEESLSFKFEVSTATLNVLRYYVNTQVVSEINASGNKAKIRVPAEKGIYRVYAFVEDKNGNVSSVNETISVSK